MHEGKDVYKHGKQEGTPKTLGAVSSVYRWTNEAQVLLPVSVAM